MFYWKTVGGLEQNLGQPEKEAARQAAWEGAVAGGVQYRLQKNSSHGHWGGRYTAAGNCQRLGASAPCQKLGRWNTQLNKHFASLLEKEPITGDHQKQRSSRTFEWKCCVFATAPPEGLHRCFTGQQMGVLSEGCLRFVSFSLALD